ncbi:hypothetical protein LCGC14_1997130 [marine sediment metagenome]|uniref:Uncharacterized protein n=1 Tax=marine sediment metagenome TaxID=412755 RepID=A0A0F9HHS9_9ZZZZ
MGKTAQSKLEQADDLNKTANKIRQRDPESARDLDTLARQARRAAIKQLRRKPKRPSTKNRTVL